MLRKGNDMKYMWEKDNGALSVNRYVLEDNAEETIYQGIENFPSGKTDIVFDRIVPPNSAEASARQKALMAFSKANRIPLFMARANTAWLLSETEQTLHADFENAPGRTLLQKGDVVLGLTDEVVGAGAVGALGLAVTAEEMRQALITGTYTLGQKETLCVQVLAANGKKQPYANAQIKDCVLAFLQQLSEKQISLQQTIVVLGGDIEDLGQEERVQILLQLKESGACAAVFDAEADLSHAVPLSLSEDGHYCAENGYGNIQDLKQLPKTEIKAVFLGGSCGGGITQLRLAASLLQGRKVAYGKRLSVSPATAAIYVQAANEGLITTIMEAGGLVLNQFTRPEIQARVGKNEIMVSNDLDNENGYAGDSSSRTFVTGTEKAVMAAIDGFLGEKEKAAEEEAATTENMVFEGRTWKFGDDIDTDIIIPTQHVTYPTMDEIKKHAFEPLRPELAAKLREGDIIVAGNNFGCGSSREQAAEVILANGVHCVVAKSFARIFFRNAINNGILLVECSGLPDAIQEGDKIRVDLKKREITANGKTFPINAIPENLYRIIAGGGLVKYVEQRMRQQGGNL